MVYVEWNSGIYFYYLVYWYAIKDIQFTYWEFQASNNKHQYQFAIFNFVFLISDLLI